MLAVCRRMLGLNPGLAATLALAIRRSNNSAGPCFVRALMKKKIKFSSYIRKFRMEQLQSHIWLTASSYMVKYLRISSYIRKPFFMYDLATAPFWISLYMRKIWFSFLSVRCICTHWIALAQKSASNRLSQFTGFYLRDTWKWCFIWKLSTVKLKHQLPMLYDHETIGKIYCVKSAVASCEPYATPSEPVIYFSVDEPVLLATWGYTLS